MVGGTIHREVIHGEISRVLVLHPALATTRCASAARAELRLDNAFVLIEGPSSRTSPATPTIVSGRFPESGSQNNFCLGNSGWMRRPMGSESGQKRRAMEALIITTPWSLSVSLSVNSRPDNRGIFIALKYRESITDT